MKMLGVDFVDSLHGIAVGTNWNNSVGFIYLSTNGGNSWTWNQYIGSGAFYDIQFIDQAHGWIVGPGTILRTTDGGETWETQINGLPSLLRNLILLKRDKVAYAFGDNYFQPPYTLLRADLSKLTSLTDYGGRIVREFRLNQNFPNPFNSSTEITYQLRQSGRVTITVYDASGRRMAELKNRGEEAGIHSVRWDASSFSTGTYFYRLKLGAFNAVRKMLLLR